jgi:hypothetical protein
VPIKLLTKRRYKFEILHKEAGNRDCLAVGWLKPGDPPLLEPTEIVPGSALEFVKRKYWTDISGKYINIIPINQPPTGETSLERLEAVSWNDPTVTRDWAEVYGELITGYIVPPKSGDYIFWIASDDNSRFRLDLAGESLRPQSNPKTGKIVGYCGGLMALLGLIALPFLLCKLLKQLQKNQKNVKNMSQPYPPYSDRD